MPNPLTIMLGIGKGKHGKPPDDMGGERKMAAAEEVLSAIKAEDSAALADALEAFVACCSGPEDMPEEGED